MTKTNQKLPLQEKEEASVLDAFCKVLKKRHIKYEVGENRETADFSNREIVDFSYKRRKFIADLDCEDDFIFIFFIHNIVVNEEDEVSLSELKKVINATNQLCCVNTYYKKTEETSDILVFSKATFHFVLENPNFAIELFMALSECLNAQYIIKEYLKKKT